MGVNSTIKVIAMFAGAAALCGCLVSEEPVLDATNGAATPLDAGAYMSCSIEEGDRDDADCTKLAVSYDETGLYHLVDEDADEIMEWRFRRVGRHGYAVQAREREDDGYAYYYGRMDEERMELTFMQCKSLPERLRARLIARGDLTADDEEFEICTVNTARGLMGAARAYHHGRAQDEEALVVDLMPAPANSSVDE